MPFLGSGKKILLFLPEEIPFNSIQVFTWRLSAFLLGGFLLSL
jgi:hypothetical protein